jgi:hypothetical protein
LLRWTADVVTEAGVSIEVQYVSTRQELWDWYWRMWRVWLWKLHLAYFALMLAFTVVLSQAPLVSRLLPGSVLGSITVILTIAYPQLRFRSQVKTVRLDQDGIERLIGPEKYRKRWKTIRSIVDYGPYITLTMTLGSAFIVPSRAFANPEQREAFKAFALDHLARRPQVG